MTILSLGAPANTSRARFRTARRRHRARHRAPPRACGGAQLPQLDVGGPATLLSTNTRSGPAPVCTTIFFTCDLPIDVDGTSVPVTPNPPGYRPSRQRRHDTRNRTFTPLRELADATPSFAAHGSRRERKSNARRDASCPERQRECQATPMGVYWARAEHRHEERSSMRHESSAAPAAPGNPCSARTCPRWTIGTLRWLRSSGLDALALGGHLADPDRLGYWTEASCRAVSERLAPFGLKMGIMMLHNVTPRIILGQPGRDEDIDKVIRSLRAAGAAGYPVIEYNFTIIAPRGTPQAGAGRRVDHLLRRCPAGQPAAGARRGAGHARGDLGEAPLLSGGRVPRG